MPQEERWRLAEPVVRHRVPPLDDETAPLKQVVADAGAAGAIHERAQLLGRQVQPAQAAQPRGHRQRQLRPGPEPDVLGDRLHDLDARLGAQIDRFEEARRQDLDPFRLVPFDGKLLRRLHPQAQAGLRDRHPHAAEPPPLLPREIEKPEVQPRLGRDVNGHRSTSARAP